MATNAGLEAALSQTATCKSLLLTGNEAEARSPQERQPATMHKISRITTVPTVERSVSQWHILHNN